MSDMPWNGKGVVSNSRTAKKLDALKQSYETVQATRRRDAIFDYLNQVYRAVRTLPEAKRQRLAQRLHGLERCNVRDSTCLFAVLVQLTTDADRRVRNRWIQALRKALDREEPPDGFSTAVAEAGGLNAYNQPRASDPPSNSKRKGRLIQDDDDDW